MKIGIISNNISFNRLNPNVDNRLLNFNVMKKQISQMNDKFVKKSDVDAQRIKEDAKKAIQRHKEAKTLKKDLII